MPYVCGGNAGVAELLHNRLLEVEIQVPRTTGSIDRIVQRKLGLERCGTGIVDFITASANPRTDGGEHGFRRDIKCLRHQLDGGGHDSRGGPRSPCVYNAHGRQTRSSKDNGEAIRSDDRQGELRAVGDKAISWHALYQSWVSGRGQDDDPIAMNLPKRHEIMKIDADRSTKSCTVHVHARTFIAAPQTQVQRGIRWLADAPEARAKGMHDDSMLAHRHTCEERYLMFGL